MRMGCRQQGRHDDDDHNEGNIGGGDGNNSDHGGAGNGGSNDNNNNNNNNNNNACGVAHNKHRFPLLSEMGAYYPDAVYAHVSFADNHSAELC